MLNPKIYGNKPKNDYFPFFYLLKGVVNDRKGVKYKGEYIFSDFLSCSVLGIPDNPLMQNVTCS